MSKTRICSTAVAVASVIGLLTACSTSIDNSATTANGTSLRSSSPSSAPSCGLEATIDPCELDAIDFGAVSKSIFLAYFEASCKVSDGMDSAGTFNQAKLWCTRPDNNTTPASWMWAGTTWPSQRRVLLRDYYGQASATDAGGCPTMSQWAAFAQPGVDVSNDPNAPPLSDKCLNSVLAGLTQIINSGNYSSTF